MKKKFRPADRGNHSVLAAHVARPVGALSLLPLPFSISRLFQRCNKMKTSGKQALPEIEALRQGHVHAGIESETVQALAFSNALQLCQQQCADAAALAPRRHDEIVHVKEPAVDEIFAYAIAGEPC